MESSALFVSKRRASFPMFAPTLGPWSVSVIVPTYEEAPNIPELLRRLAAVRRSSGLDLELILMDDDSRDGSVEAVAEFGADWAEIVVRTGERGLSAAVTEGLYRARHEILVVMDADLSHPPEKIPELVEAVFAGADFVIGSRYVEGGSTDDDWGPLRFLNSRVATLLARPLTTAEDPMAGFFALRRSSLDGVSLNAIGYKIGLELIVKCGLERVVEIPIHFHDRVRGESKLSLAQQLLYLRHLRRLYIHKFAAFSEIVQFALVGASGVLVNLLALTALVALGVPETLSVALAIALGMLSNFALNRRFTFAYARGEGVWRQLVGFCAACSVGAVVNLAVTVGLARAAPGLRVEVAALAGVAAGLGFNFLANRFLVFKRRHFRPAAAQPSRPEAVDEAAPLAVHRSDGAMPS